MPQSTIVDTFFHQTPCYHVRITSDLVDLEKTFEAFVDKANFLIVSQEGTVGTSHLHQHILLGSFFFKDRVGKQAIKDIVLELYPSAIGNAGHSIKVARSKQCLAQYVLKDGCYKTHGFTSEFLAKAKLLSYNHKASKHAFVELMNRVILGELTLLEYACGYWKLKADSGQPIYKHHVQAHLVSVAVRIGEISPHSAAERMVYNILND